MFDNIYKLDKMYIIRICQEIATMMNDVDIYEHSGEGDSDSYRVSPGFLVLQQRRAEQESDVLDMRLGAVEHLLYLIQVWMWEAKQAASKKYFGYSIPELEKWLALVKERYRILRIKTSAMASRPDEWNRLYSQYARYPEYRNYFNVLRDYKSGRI